MSLACTLGLVVCLHFRGQVFTAEKATDIMSGCEDLLQAAPSSFGNPPPPRTDVSVRDQVRDRFRHHMGYVTGEWLADNGLKLDWPESPSHRRLNWVGTCVAFREAFYGDSAWDRP